MSELYTNQKYLKQKLKKDLKNKLSCKRLVHSITIDNDIYYTYMSQISICYSLGRGAALETVIIDIAKLNQPNYIVWQVHGTITVELIDEINKCLFDLSEFRRKGLFIFRKNGIIED